MGTADLTTLIHPAIAISFIFPTVGILLYFALQTRQRRLQLKAGTKSKVPPVVGTEHLRIGKILSGGVVGLALLGIGQPIFSKFISNNSWSAEPGRAWFVTLLFALTVASLVFLYRASQKHWRAIFAVLTGMGVIVLGCQPEVFRRGFEWQVSHYYYGISVTMLMIFALATFPEIYSDRSNRWRNVHIALNSIAVLFFLGQAVTGARDLLEIPLDWQKPYIEQLYIQNCQSQACTVQPPAQPAQQPPG